VTVLALLSSSCLPPASNDDDSQCPSDQEYSTYEGRTTCRTTCVTEQPCSVGQRCLNGVCVRESDASEGDAAMDTGVDGAVDTGRCSDTTRLTIYRGVKKCRAYCDGDGECEGDLKCLDGHCVDRSLQRSDTGPTDTGVDADTSDTTEDTGPDVTPGSLSCHRIIRCQQACATRTCRQNVVDEGSRQGTQDFNDYTSCISSNCPQRDQRCIDTNCSTEQDACFPPSVSGQNLNCNKFFICLGNCPQRDMTCRRDCRSRATSTATSKYQAILQCIDTECSRGTDACIRNAISGACKTEWETCLACP